MQAELGDGRGRSRFELRHDRSLHAVGLTGVTRYPLRHKYFVTKKLGRFQLVLAPTMAIVFTLHRMSRRYSSL